MKISMESMDGLKRQALHFAASYDHCILLDNNVSVNAAGLHDHELILAAGAKHSLHITPGDEFGQLKEFIGSGRHAFGFLTYDLKNSIESLSSANPDRQQFPSMFFFEPRILLTIDKDLNVGGDPAVLELIGKIEIPQKKSTAPVQVRPRVSREHYLRDVELIRQHIIEGDVYELNYCVEFFAENVDVDPVHLYERLSAYSPTPFGAFMKYNDHFLVCASPERFMKKSGDRLYSQPIKGTIKRGIDAEDDEKQKQALVRSEKERAENLMIVDLVRNDLAKSSITGSVKVEELFGIYSFSHVHQMISTVSSRMQPSLHPVDAIRNAFPMGSMTGAPKIKAMELIEQYEQTKRGIYSGALGYFTPSGDFDLNVVIRSLQYNRATGYLSFEVGSAITFDSRPEDEYDECMLKAKAMMHVLENIA